MAVLSDSDRQQVWLQFMRENQETTGVLKADLRAAINAADQWADDNAVTFNLTLPAAARSALNARQKARLLAAVLRRRFEIL